MNVLKRINFTLLILVLIGGLCLGGVALYNKINNIENSKIVRQLEG